MNIKSRKILAFMCMVTTVLLITACKADNQSKYNATYDFAVIETTGEENESIVSYYDQELNRINQQVLPYGGLTDSFTPAIISKDTLYASPEGLENGEGLCLSLGVDLNTGKVREFQHPKRYEGEKNQAVDKKRIFVNTNLNGNSFLSYYDTETEQSKDVTLKETVLGHMAVDTKYLYAFGEDNKHLTAEGDPCTQIYVFDKETLKKVKQKDLGAVYSMVFSLVYDNQLYFPAYDEIKETSALCRYDAATGALKMINFPKQQSDFSNILVNRDKLYIAHGSVVTGQGKVLTIYDPKNNKMKEAEFSHNLSQIVIKHDNLYALDNDPNTETAKLYKYKMSNDKFSLIGSADVYTKKGSKNPYFYIGSFFVK